MEARRKKRHTLRHFLIICVMAMIVLAVAAAVLGILNILGKLPGQDQIYNPPKPVLVAAPANAPGTAKIEVPYISQEGLLPTGCELVSGLMALRYYGKNVTIGDLLNKLEYGILRNASVGPYDYVGPSPDWMFVGDPRSSEGFGCYPPVIARLLNRFLPGNIRAVDVSGSGLEALAQTYLPKGKPVLVWVTIHMEESGPGISWLLERPGTNPRTGLGESFTWVAGEHCMVLTGYDETSYYFNDPYEGSGAVAYEKPLADARFRELGNRAVAVE